MMTPTYHNYPAAGQALYDRWGYSQAVVLPAHAQLVKLAGQGGWDGGLHTTAADVDGQIKLAFKNVEAALAAAGVEDGWRAVFLVRSYHVGMARSVGLFSALLKDRAPQGPVWTCVEVVGLATAEMKIEIEVEAVKM